MVARPRLLATVLRVCADAVILCGALTFAPVLSPRDTTAAAIVLVGVFCLSARVALSTVMVHSRFPTLVRLTVITELS